MAEMVGVDIVQYPQEAEKQVTRALGTQLLYVCGCGRSRLSTFAH